MPAPEQEIRLCTTRDGARIACARIGGGAPILKSANWMTHLGLSDRDPPELSFAWCRDKMAGYKRPRSISFIEEADVPRTAMGKILHRVLRDKLAREN